MDDLNITNSQQMLEDLFRALYMHFKEGEDLRVQAEQDRNAYQEQWCNKFMEIFSFVSKYGGKMTLHTNTDFQVKLYHCDKCSVGLISEKGGYGIEIHPPEPGSDKCRCLEHYLFEHTGNKELYLTLPEITVHISNGLAKSDADGKHLEGTK